MTIRFSKKFAKQYDKSPSKIKSAVNNRILIFKENPFNSLLNNHTLKGRFAGYRSINITGDWRAMYSEKGEKSITFELLGTHSQLYG